MGITKIRFPNTSGIGIKPVSREGIDRLVRKAIQYAIDNNKPSATVVYKGNIMKFTEGSFRDWAYGLAQREFGAELLNGDYVSGALAVQMGRIGIAPGANLSGSVACFEATHGTAPKYPGNDYVNPGSEILLAEMMLRHTGELLWFRPGHG